VILPGDAMLRLAYTTHCESEGTAVDYDTATLLRLLHRFGLAEVDVKRRNSDMQGVSGVLVVTLRTPVPPRANYVLLDVWVTDDLGRSLINARRRYPALDIRFWMCISANTDYRRSAVHALQGILTVNPRGTARPDLPPASAASSNP
jgi:hypothetical protein